MVTLSSCGVLFDDPIERFWNGDYSVSDIMPLSSYKERRIFYENESARNKVIEVLKMNNTAIK